MRTVKKDKKTGLPEKYLSGSKNRAARAASIEKGKEAYKKGEKLPDSYFDERQEYKKGGKVKTGKGAKEGKKPLNASTVASLKKKAKSSGKSLSTLKKVYRRGQGAYLSSGSRPNTTQTCDNFIRFVTSTATLCQKQKREPRSTARMPTVVQSLR